VSGIACSRTDAEISIIALMLRKVNFRSIKSRHIVLIHSPGQNLHIRAKFAEQCRIRQVITLYSVNSFCLFAWIVPTSHRLLDRSWEGVRVEVRFGSLPNPLPTGFRDGSSCRIPL